MTVTIELPPEIEAGLAARAAAQGISLQQYLRHLLEEQGPHGRPVTPAERAAFWRQIHDGPAAYTAVARRCYKPRYPLRTRG